MQTRPVLVYDCNEMEEAACDYPFRVVMVVHVTSTSAL